MQGSVGILALASSFRFVREQYRSRSFAANSSLGFFLLLCSRVIGAARFLCLLQGCMGEEGAGYREVLGFQLCFFVSFVREQYRICSFAGLIAAQVSSFCFVRAYGILLKVCQACFLQKRGGVGRFYFVSGARTIILSIKVRYRIDQQSHRDANFSDIHFQKK